MSLVKIRLHVPHYHPQILIGIHGDYVQILKNGEGSPSAAIIARDSADINAWT